VLRRGFERLDHQRREAPGGHDLGGGRCGVHAVRSELFTAAGRGEIEAVVHELLPLDEAVLAHRKMDAGEVFGRIVLLP
jgi:NADPH:quinone reductase-like Zn-dependent oxidoreductase